MPTRHPTPPFDALTGSRGTRGRIWHLQWLQTMILVWMLILAQAPDDPAKLTLGMLAWSPFVSLIVLMIAKLAIAAAVAANAPFISTWLRRAAELNNRLLALAIRSRLRSAGGTRPSEGTPTRPSEPVASNQIFSHWFTMLEGFRASPSEFYRAVERKIAEHRIPNVRTEQIKCSEGGPLAAKRVYLRVTRKDKIFDICGAPFGSGFFVSWWLGSRPPGLLRWAASRLARVPIVGRPFRRAMNTTYFQIDSMLMFQKSVHAAVTDAVDAMVRVQGLRPLADLDKKPVMNF